MKKLAGFVGSVGFVLGATTATGCSSGGAEVGGSGGADASGGAESSTGGILASGGAVSGTGGGTGGATTGGVPGSGGGLGSGGAPTDGKPAPVRSAGCGKALGSFRTGVQTITSTGKQREYTIDVPADYDPEKAHRLIFTWHWINASDEAVVRGDVPGGNGGVWAYYGLKRQADVAGEPAIFVAPQSQDGRWSFEDHTLFDDILAKVGTELCIDEGRVFSTGFSFGAMQTYSLSVGKGDKLRAVAPIAPANFNIDIPEPTDDRVAYMSSTGMSDTLTPWVGNEQQRRGAKFAALLHAERNGCTIPDVIPTTTAGSRTHVCFDFEGCDEGYPVKVCTYDGGHIAAPADGGNSDNGATTWIPGETWEFFTQF